MGIIFQNQFLHFRKDRSHGFKPVFQQGKKDILGLQIDTILYEYQKIHKCLWLYERSYSYIHSFFFTGPYLLHRAVLLPLPPQNNEF